MTRGWTRDEVLAVARRCSNRGRWGPEDARGTLNLVDAACRRRAAALIRTADVIPLGVVAEGSAAVALEVAAEVSDGMLVAAIEVGHVRPHGFDVTHLDALGHSFLDEEVFDGRHAAQVVEPGGLVYGDVRGAASGVLTRGVLLDIAAALDMDRLEPDWEVTAEHLELAEGLSGTTVSSGDAIFVRAGFDLLAEPAVAERRPGLGPDTLEWMHDRDVSIYAGDCIDRIPSGIPGIPLPVHQVGMASMGLWFLDNPDVPALRAACRQHDTFEFAVVIAIPPVPGATGSMVNPLAIF